eukprot:s1855_g4.t1
MRAKMCSDEWAVGGVFLRFHRPWSSKTCSELARSESMCQEVAILQRLNHPERTVSPQPFVSAPAKDVHQKKRPAESPSNPRKEKRKKPPKMPTGHRPVPPRTPPPAAPKAEMDCGPVDHAQLFRRLLHMKKTQVLEELRKLPEETLNMVALFLHSDEAEKFLCAPGRLALQYGWKTRKPPATCVVFKNKSKGTEMPKAPKTPKQRKIRDTRTPLHTDGGRPLKGIKKRGNGSYAARICLYRGFMASGQCVRDLDVAVDMHISLVQMRQHIAAGLAKGRDLKQVVQDAIDAVQGERSAASAVELCLRFQSFYRHSYTLTVHDLESAIQDWMGREAPEGKPLALARVKHRRLPWSSLQLSSFQSADDSLCVTIRLMVLRPCENSRS